MSTVCVYCGSSPGINPRFMQVTQQMGVLLGQNQWTLVYGAGGVGIMGQLAKSVKQHGGRVEGIIPQSLVETEHAWSGCDEMVVTQTMRERKHIMDSRAEAFLVLPGGFGTLEELAEILTLKILGYTDRPLILLDYDNYWKPLLDLFDHFIEEGFGKQSDRKYWNVAKSPEQALELLVSLTTLDT